MDSDATDRSTLYADADADTYGDATDADGDGMADNMVMACEMPSGYVANMDDCNDLSHWLGPAPLKSVTVSTTTVWMARPTHRRRHVHDGDMDGYGDNSTEMMSS